MKYTQAELYYYFKKELSKKYNIFMDHDYNISDNSCFIIEHVYEDSISRMGECLSNFSFESIQVFLETHKERYDLKIVPHYYEK